MPTYQYACTECGHDFDQVQSFSDDALEYCPECNGRLRKVFNAVGVVFKGSGFYRTDNRSANRDTAATATSSGTPSGASSTTSSDSSSSATAPSSSSTSSSSTSSS